MPEYIERKATCKDCLHVNVCIFRDASEDEKICRQFKNKADVVEVRHGEWMVEAYPVDSDEVVILPYKDHQHNDPFCSICGEHALLNGGEEYVTSNYCPNCGAKMDGKGEGE